MWSDAGGGGFNTNLGGDEAGFDTQPFASPGPEVKKSRRIESVLPLTIKTVLELDENNQEYLGSQVNMVTLVGLIKEVEVSTTKVTYTVDDTTGTIPVVKWIDLENEEAKLMENTYCRAHGTYKTYQGMKQLLALHLEPVTNLNWITAHILEVVHTAIKLKRIHEEPTGKGGAMAGSSGAMSKSMVGIGDLAGSGFPGRNTGGMDMGGGLGGLNLNKEQRMVFEIIRSAPNDSEDSGYSREHLKAKLKGKVLPQQVNQILFFLSSEGHVYTTVDEDHFKATDA